ncbi:MAG: MarR family transcriptional regulator [Methanomicrobiales archaeon]|nr:MarR family transcriptional regulator [Methanomicrobiales archaeon]
MPAPASVALHQYSPGALDRETLQYLLVGRQKLAESLFEEIDQAAGGGTPRFFLLIGPRGTGKSHLMALLYEQVRDDLSGRAIPVKLGEEEYSIFRASDFFLRVLEDMGACVANVAGDDQLVRDVAVDTLREIASRENRQIVIFVENIHELFTQMDRCEIQALRSVFQQTNIFSVIASAPQIFPGVSDHDEPFYNFFRIFRLQELKCAEIKELMKKIARISGNTAFIENFQDYEPAIEALFHLIGGNPRLTIRLYEAISHGGADGAAKIFSGIMDGETPYYREAFRRLTGQRRLILDTILCRETPLTPKEIAEISRLDPAVVNAQLRRLERDGYVTSRPMGKRTSYEARDRLFRLWRVMRRPAGRERLAAFIRFLEAWHGRPMATREELLQESLAPYVAGRWDGQLGDPAEAVLVLALEEMLAGNRANGLSLIAEAYGHVSRPDQAAVRFLKQIIEEGEVSQIRDAVHAIISSWGPGYEEFLEPVLDAVAIIETQDTGLYYTRLQPEERVVVAGIVRAITGTDELVV